VTHRMLRCVHPVIRHAATEWLHGAPPLHAVWEAAVAGYLTGRGSPPLEAIRITERLEEKAYHGGAAVHHRAGHWRHGAGAWDPMGAGWGVMGGADPWGYTTEVEAALGHPLAMGAEWGEAAWDPLAVDGWM